MFLLSKIIFLIIKNNLSLFSINLIKFLFTEFSDNFVKKYFFSKKLNKKKGQILFDNF